MPRCNAIASSTGKRCRLMGSNPTTNPAAKMEMETDSCLCAIHARKKQDPRAICRMERPPSVGTCAICLDDIKPKQETEVDTCKHVFHRSCMVQWMEKNNISCPYCRHVMDEGEFTLTYMGRLPYARLPDQKKYMSKVHYLVGLLKQTMKEHRINPASTIDEVHIINMFQMAWLLNPRGSRMESLVGFENLVRTFIASTISLPSV